MPRTGRPPLDNPRTIARHIRFTPDEDALITAAAERAGQSAAEWMRGKLLATPRRRRLQTKSGRVRIVGTPYDFTASNGGTGTRLDVESNDPRFPPIYVDQSGEVEFGDCRIERRADAAAWFRAVAEAIEDAP